MEKDLMKRFAQHVAVLQMFFGAAMFAEGLNGMIQHGEQGGDGIRRRHLMIFGDGFERTHNAVYQGMHPRGICPMRALT